MNENWMLIGAGYSARAFAPLALAHGANVVGTTRDPAKAERLAGTGIMPILFDGNSVSPDMEQALASTTHLVVSAAPGEAGDPVIAAASAMLKAGMPGLRWIAYLSTVGVYGNHDGAWVDEDSECRPRPGRSDFRLETEGQWQALSAERGVALAILRLSGIYGPGRNALANLAGGTARRIIKQGQIFNRIHVADIAGALDHLGRLRADGIYNVTDDEPSPPQDVVEHAAALMGVEPPPAIGFETANLSPMARSFYGENKRVSNAKLKRSGYAFAFPDYRSALDAMWRDHNWR